MSIQFAGGTIVNNVWTATSGTLTELADQIKTQLVNAGWTATGTSGNWTVTSATTPQGLAAACTVRDPGSGNCTQIKMQNAAGSHVQAGALFLLPAAAKQWQIIANKYHFWVFTPGASAVREFACGGTLYVPSFVGITEGIWSNSNAQTDTDATKRTSLRTRPAAAVGNDTPGNSFLDTNGTVTEFNTIGASTYPGALQLFGTTALSWAFVPNYRWFDNSYPVSEALIGWGNATTTEAKIVGQLWDAFWASGDFSTDATVSYSGHTFWAMTNNNVGSSAQYPRGTLFVAVN